MLKCVFFDRFVSLLFSRTFISWVPKSCDIIVSWCGLNLLNLHIKYSWFEVWFYQIWFDFEFWLIGLILPETLGFGSEIGSFIVPFIIGLVSGIILVLLLLCCCRKIKGESFSHQWFDVTILSKLITNQCNNNF